MSRVPEGKITNAFFCSAPAFAADKYKRGRRGQGIRYEKSIHAYFKGRYPLYLESPWIAYEDDTGRHWCQPDALYFDFESGTITIVEVKFQHTLQAWWQLVDLYLPVVRRLFPPNLWKYQMLEVVRWYDADIPWPKQPKLIAKPFEGSYLYGVHICRP